MSPRATQSGDNTGQNHFYALSHLSILEIIGPDAQRFLQGQLTCNLQDVDRDGLRSGCLLNVKGRAMASFLLCRLQPDHYLMLLPADMLEPARQQLAKYIVFSKAELRVDDSRRALLGSSGSACDALASLIELPQPAANWQASTGPDSLLLRLPGDTPDTYRLLLIASLPTTRTLATQKYITDKKANSEDWLAQDCLAGLAHISPATVDHFIPLELGFQHTGGVSFNKGCYLGQEIVARLHYRGKAKEHLYRACLSTPAPAGSPLIAPGQHNEQAVGHVIQSARLGSEAIALLVVRDDARHLPLQLPDFPGTTVSELSLVYNDDQSN